VQRTRTRGHAQKIGVYDSLRGEIVMGARWRRAMMLAAFGVAVKRESPVPPMRVLHCLRIGASLLAFSSGQRAAIRVAPHTPDSKQTIPMARDRTERRRQQRANVVRKQQTRNMKPFYIALGAIAIAGVALIAISARRGTGTPSAVDVKATPAQAEGYLMGNPKAPVQIYEFADFECPACATFATITEPDVRKRIVDAGLASYRYFDFPLEQHHNSLAASNAAACAADQGKFWEMHDKLFYDQPEWNSEATDRPEKFFQKYAGEIGLNLTTWKTCVDAQSHMQRILSNRAEGMRRHVQSTPTFVIGDKMVAGALSYDQFKTLVDSATARLASARPDSQPGPRTAQ